jgi:hypothetical protein
MENNNWKWHENPNGLIDQWNGSDGWAWVVIGIFLVWLFW